LEETIKTFSPQKGHSVGSRAAPPETPRPEERKNPKMKIKFLGGLLSLALCCSTALPTSAQEKDQADSFLYRAVPANPELAQQLDVINRQLDEAFNKHDAVAVAALFTVNAILMAPAGIFSGRDGIEKYFSDGFQRLNPSDHLTKISRVYALGGDLCGIGGRSMTIYPGRPIQGAVYLIRVYTRVGDTWKIRAEVDKSSAGL
jgi:ketosteroid isomerase-like protein